MTWLKEIVNLWILLSKLWQYFFLSFILITWTNSQVNNSSVLILVQFSTKLKKNAPSVDLWKLGRLEMLDALLFRWWHLLVIFVINCWKEISKSHSRFLACLVNAIKRKDGIASLVQIQFWPNLKKNLPSDDLWMLGGLEMLDALLSGWWHLSVIFVVNCWKEIWKSPSRFPACLWYSVSVQIQFWPNWKKFYVWLISKR